MKFVHVKIPATVAHYDNVTQEVEKTETGTLSIQMFVSNGDTTEEVLKRLGEAITDRLKLVDLGDED